MANSSWNILAIFSAWRSKIVARIQNFRLIGWIQVLRRIAHLPILPRELSGIILSGTGLFLERVYDRISRRDIIEAAMADYSLALKLTPPGRFYRANILDNSTDALISSYVDWDNRRALDPAVANARESLSLRPVGHKRRWKSLLAVTKTLRAGFEKTGKVEDIDEAISLLKEAVICAPPSSRCHAFGRLAAAYYERYQRIMLPQDLEDAVKYGLEEVAQATPASRYRATALNHLGRYFFGRFELTRDVQDLQTGIAHIRESLRLCSVGDPVRHLATNNLAIGLKIRHDRLRNVEDLQEAITLHREGLDSVPLNHPSRHMHLNNLGTGLIARYTLLGNIEDLNEAIACHTERIKLSQYGDPRQAPSLANLGQAQLVRYNRFQRVDDLEESITNIKEALQYYTHPNDERATTLTCLAAALHARYDRFGELQDLDDDIKLLEEVLTIRPPGSESRAQTLNRLSIALNTRSSHRDTKKAFSKAVDYQREALSLTPPGHPSRAWCLNNLGNSLHSKYLRFMEIQDLDEAITCHKAAVDLRPPGDEHRATSVHNLANCLKARFERFQDISDLEASISLFRESLSLESDRAPTKPMIHNNLALVLQMKYKRFLGVRDLQELQDHALAASEGRFYRTEARLRAAMYWANQIRTEVQFRCQILSNAIDLLQHMLIVNPDLSSQQERLQSVEMARDLPSRAAAAAIESEDLELAVTLLEQGRSVVLNNLQRYRSPVDELQSSHPELAERFQSISSQLESLSQSTVKGSTLDGSADYKQQDLGQFLQAQDALRKDWDDTVQKIRLTPGFEHFLSVPSYTRLQAAARDGPVILLNTCETRSDAIIMFASGPPRHIPFPEIKSDKLQYYQYMLSSSRMENANKEEAVLLQVLRYLWTNAVSMIVDCLVEEGIAKGSRVWWCPANDFCSLPIHAAGLYGRTLGTNFPDLYISSYTPTVTSLMKVKEHPSRSTPVSTTEFPSPPSRTLLFIGHAGGNLENVDDELESIVTVGSGVNLEVKPLMEKAATPSAVLEAMKNNPWVHLSCHGRILPRQPLYSYFQLSSEDIERLTVRDLLSARLPSSEFAFLSACHSAGGGESLPDESLHLTAALQFCGFRSVVGTLWEMYDEEGPEITKDFYKRLMKLGGQYDNAAAALHFAIRQCRKRRVGIEKWAMFVHFGA